ncbi:MAG: hypothetical protein KDK99_00820 [Verrucomicrobiales bacterium]|nr:hypothetical protein [Verrucomicrobiales bacterium]
MNLILHQFRKDFRYLRWRWVAYLAVLAVDLAYQMEWIFPMKLEDSDSDFYLAGCVVWLMGIWVGLSVSPEDEGDSSFVSTRPLPKLQFWLARLTLWFGLIAVPMALEAVVFLALQGRPSGEWFTVVWETLWSAGAVGLWVIPGAFLFRHWERYAALVVFAALWGFYAHGITWVFYQWTKFCFVPTQPYEFPDRFLTAAWFVGGWMAMLLIWHRRKHLSLVVRMVVLGLLVQISYTLAVSGLVESWHEKPLEQDRVTKATGGLRPQVPLAGLEFEQQVTDQGRGLVCRADAWFDETPKEMLPVFGRLVPRLSQHGVPLSSWSLSSVNFADSPDSMGIEDQTADLMRVLNRQDSGWLGVDSNASIKRDSWIAIREPKDPNARFDVELDLSVWWTRDRVLGRVPLQAGSKIVCPNFECEVLEVRVGKDREGQKNPDAISLIIRESACLQMSRNSFLPVPPLFVLTNQQKSLVWRLPITNVTVIRSVRLGWMQRVSELTFRSVIGPGTGVTAESVRELSFAVIKSDYLGQTSHRVKWGDVPLAEHISSVKSWPDVSHALNRESNPRRQLAEEVKKMQTPNADATLGDIETYLAEVVRAAWIFADREELDRYSEPLWPGDDIELIQAVEFCLKVYPELEERLKIPALRGTGYFWSVLERAGVKGFVPDHRETPIEEMALRFSKSVAPTTARRLFNDVRFRQLAVSETQRQYERLPAVVGLDLDQLLVLASQAALGDSAALDWLLRAAAMKDRRRRQDLTAAVIAHQGVSAEDITPRQAADFIADCRFRRAADYRFQPETLSWKFVNP